MSQVNLSKKAEAVDEELASRIETCQLGISATGDPKEKESLQKTLIKANTDKVDFGGESLLDEESKASILDDLQARRQRERSPARGPAAPTTSSQAEAKSNDDDWLPIPTNAPSKAKGKKKGG